MKEIREKIQERFNEMCATGMLFRSSVTGDELWEQYISGFENDPVFRDPNNSTHNCNLCKHFIRRYGNIIAFDKNYNLMTMWDIDCPDEEYKNSLEQMSTWIKLGVIRDIFVETLDSLKKTNYGPSKANQSEYNLGNAYNIKRYTKEEAAMYPNSGIKENDVYRFEHLALVLPAQFVDNSGRSIEQLMGEYRSKAQVFQRGLNEISLDTLYFVRDLEAQGSLLNGNSYKHFILGAIKAKEEYDKIPNSKKNIWVWVNTAKVGIIAGFRNTAIGTLIVELSEGKEINEAVKAFNKMVDPVNYMRATAPITKAQIAQAEKFVEENGYVDSFERRCATIDDIMVSDILHSNISAAEVKTKVSVFDKVKSTVPTRHKRSEFDNVEEVTIEKFMSDILPNCTSVEVYLMNKHKKNFVNLLTSVNKDSKHMFKWNNNFSWTYNGNLAGKSEITKAVKAKGGCVDAPLRCSIIWNEKGDAMHTDFDNHCYESSEDHICYYNHRSDRGERASIFGGYLDIDITDPRSQCNGGPGVENIYYPTYKDGTYEFQLHNFNGGDNKGGRAEIYFEGTLYQYEIKRSVREYIKLATLHIKNHKLVKIEQSQYFVGDEKSDNIYGLDTNQFHKVNLVCLSPNYWEDQGVGNKHYFFMLEGAQNPDEIRSIHNEFLNDELRNHRKVMEVLGTTLKVESTKGQLCGLGFNSTVRDEVILRLRGSHKRIIKIKF